MWILLEQETVSGSGISWAICKSAPRSRQITTPVPHTQFFTGRVPFLPPNQQRQSTDGTNIEGTFKDLQKKLDERERERSLDSAAQESVKVVHGAVCV